MKILKRILIVSATILVLLIVTSILVSLLYKNKIAEVVLEEIDRSGDTRIEIRDVRLTLLKNFPLATVDLNNIFISSSKDYLENNQDPYVNDTLLFARHIYLQMNILDFIRGEYRIRKVQIDNGILNIGILEDGTNNFRFLRKQNNDTEGELILALNDLQFKRTRIRHHNNKSQLMVEAMTRNLTLSGNFSTDTSRFAVNGEVLLERLKTRSLDVKPNIPLSTGFEMEINQRIVELYEGTAMVAKMQIQVVGTLDRHSRELDFTLSGSNVKLGSLLSLMPPKGLKDININSLSGRVNYDLSIGGIATPGQPPQLNAKFSVMDGRMALQQSALPLSNVFLTGSYTNGPDLSKRSSIIEVSRYEVLVNGEKTTGKLLISNLDRPVVEGEITGTMDTRYYHRIFPFKMLEAIDGKCRVNLMFEFPLEKNKGIRLTDPRSIKATGNIALQDIDVKLGDVEHPLKNINGDILFNESVWLDNIVFDFRGMNTRWNVELGNALPFLMNPGQRLFVSGDVYIPEIVTDVFKNQDPARKSRNGVPFPRYLEMDILFKGGSFSYNEFSAKEIETNISYRPRIYIVHRMSFNSMAGRVSVNGALWEMSDSTVTVTAQAILQQLETKMMFSHFNNFGQQFLTNEHISGRLDGDINFRALFSKNLKIDMPSLVTYASIHLEEGELLGFEPMLGLSRFVEVDELKHIRFSTLENDIYIENELITIPQMELASNAFNITLSGTHSFSNKFDYKTKLLLSDVLSRKARLPREEQNEFGTIEDDGVGNTSLYLSISGNPDNYRVKYDRDAVRHLLKERLRQEGRELKTIFKEEFGLGRSESLDSLPPALLFENDSTAMKRNDSLPKKPKFRVIWEEELPDTIRKK